MSLKISSACSLCDHHYAHLSDQAEMYQHMAEAHDMHFITGPFPSRPYWRKEVSPAP